MKRYDENVIEKVRKLRHKEHYSFLTLSRMTMIPSTTIRNWCVDNDTGTKWDTLLQTNKRKRDELLHSEINAINIVNISNKTIAKLLSALLYWCEGSKYPGATAVTMVNSDPQLLVTFISLFRRAFILDEAKFHVHLQIHTTHNYKKLRKYWSNLLHISENKFMKPTITQPHGKKHKKYYSGTCTVKYQDYRLLLKLMGIYEAFAEKSGEVA